MALFKNSYYSHQHSLNVLNLLREYDTFLESLSSIADMGCGEGLDALWWAELTTRDDRPIPLDYRVYAVDKNTKQLAPEIANHKRIIVTEGDFSNVVTPNVDLIWAHDVLQYSNEPIKTLTAWKQTLNLNGMLVISVPQSMYYDYAHSRMVVESHDHQFQNYNLLNLMYMLALTGFDCRDAYFYRDKSTPWLYAAVYASNHEPLNPDTTWYELADRHLVNDSVINSINLHGYAKLQDIVVTWLDKNHYLITD
jgi:SAM-dependent methyltransferase